MDAEQEAGRLYAFTDVVAPYNQTTKVLRNLLSCNSLGDGEHWASKPPLTAVFKKNGYWVSIQDNQKSTGDHALSDLFEFSLSTYLYNPQMAAACYNNMNDITYLYDGELVEAYQQQHMKKGDSAAQRLVVFHLMGQHVSYKERYPKEDAFCRFTADSTAFRQEEWLSTEMRQEIAYYDNATLYNDSVIHEITQLYADKSSVVIYLSDHGEEVYDYRPRYGREGFQLDSDARQQIRYQFCTPFIVWCSEKYKAHHTDIVNRLQQAIDRPLMIDNTCHLLFHLAELQTPYYRAERDVLSDDYHCPPRILNDDYSY